MVFLFGHRGARRFLRRPRSDSIAQNSETADAMTSLPMMCVSVDANHGTRGGVPHMSEIQLQAHPSETELRAINVDGERMKKKQGLRGIMFMSCDNRNGESVRPLWSDADHGEHMAAEQEVEASEAAIRAPTESSVDKDVDEEEGVGRRRGLGG